MKKIITILALVFLCACNPSSGNKRFDHQGLKINFPASEYNFARLWIRNFDLNKSDMGSQYLSRSGINPIMITVYVYPGPQLTSIGSPEDVVYYARKKLTDGHFKQVQAEIVKKYPGASLILDKESKTNFRGKNLYGRIAKYNTYNDFFKKGQKQKLISSVEIFAFDNWIIKFRVTYLNDFAKGLAEAEVAKFEREFFSTNEVVNSVGNAAAMFKSL